MTASGRRAEQQVLVAPRLVFFLVRRRLAYFKDTARTKIFDDMRTRWSQFRAFLREEDVSIAELTYAVGYLMRSAFYPAAAFLTALATLLATVFAVGRL
jgi:hypothetical protein